MRSVDYSRYYINKRDRGVGTGKQETGNSDQGTGNWGEERVCEENPKEKRRKNNRSNVVIILLVLLTFLLTFAFAGLYSTGSVLGVFSSGNQVGYYAVYKNVGKDYAAAQAQSTLVRSGGGGGNVVKLGEEYCVVYATYLDKGSAENVASREEGLEVRELTLSNMTAKSGESEAYVEEYNQLRIASIERLYEAAITYAKDASDNELSSIIAALTLEWTELRKSVDQDENLETSEKLSIIVAIDTVTGRLESITYADTEVEKLSNVWYQTYCLVEG